MNIPKLIKEAHDNAVERGFYDCPQCENGNHVDDTDSENVILTKCEDCNGTGIDPNINIGELLMLIVSVLGEALEAHRNNRFADPDGNFKYLDLIGTKEWETDRFLSWFKENIKDTREDKIADVFIRLFDLCGYLKIEPTNYVKERKKEIRQNIGDYLFFIVKLISTLPTDSRESYKNLHVQIMIYQIIHELLYFCEFYNIPIEKHIKAKQAYNRTRPHKHGKEY